MMAADGIAPFPMPILRGDSDAFINSTMAVPEATLTTPWPDHETWAIGGRGYAYKDRRLGPAQVLTVTAWWAGPPAPLTTIGVDPQCWLRGIAKEIENSLLQRGWLLEEARNWRVGGYCRSYFFAAISPPTGEDPATGRCCRRSGRICRLQEHSLFVHWEYSEHRSITANAFGGFHNEAHSFLESFTLFGRPQ